LTQLNLWTTKKIADELNLSVSYVLQVIYGNFPFQTLEAQKVGDRWLISEKEALRFIDEYRNPQHYTPQDIATAIGKSRKYVLDSLTGYGGRRKPRLAGEKRGDRWVISRIEGDRFINLHRNEIAETQL
jgi:AraC-like DNA-binding protein